MKKKPTHEISTEDLLNQLESEDTVIEEDIEYVNDVSVFIRAFKISGGERKVHGNLLYRLYRKWSEKPLSNIEFHRTMSLYFDKNEQHTTYHLNYTGFEIRRFIDRFMIPTARTGLGSKAAVQGINKFIEAYKIEDGNKWIRAKYVYILYGVFCKENKTLALKHATFCQVMNTKFTNKIDNNSKVRYYKLNPNSFLSLPEEVRMEIKRSRTIGDKNVKKEDKKDDKVPGS